MQKTRLQKLLSFIVCIVLIAAMALVTTGCGDKKETKRTDVENVSKEEVQVLGEGKTEFTFTVTDDKGEVTTYEIHTDKKIVGEALQELELIEGEEGQYGLYVKTVNGMTFDYDKDGKYWSFYVDGEYAQKGIDMTEIEKGVVYSLVVE